MKILVIVESFTKEKTIQMYLQKAFSSKNYSFVVKACGGHICDMVKKNMGLNTKTLQPIYEPIPSKKKSIDTLKQLVLKSDLTLLASDNDREGEAIAWHLMNILKPKNYKRIIFNEITQSALYNAVSNQKDIDMDMVNSQQARRVLDRIVGFKLTPMLWQNFSSKTTLSAGRVQSVVLMIVVDKEKAVTQFVSEKYWSILNTFDNDIVDSKLYKNDKMYKLRTKEEVIETLKLLGNNKYTLKSSDTKYVLEKPDKAFTTSTLQQKAHSKGFSIKETMKVAQELYELGHITYMRTDSTILSNDFQELAFTYITKEFGKNSVNSKTSSTSKKSQKNAQEAHEAIRPTKLIKEIPTLSPRQSQLYSIIFKRTIASLMIPAKYKELTLQIYHENLKDDMYFVGKIKQLIEYGFKEIYKEDSDIKIVKESVFDKITNEMKSKKDLKSIEARGNCIWTSPPQRFNESSIIKTMEESGIGRPSTYVSIINKLYERNFIVKTNCKGEEKVFDDYILKDKQIKKHEETKEVFDEKNKLVPTDIGDKINAFLVKNFNEIINIDFTSSMENNLDEIANGKKTYNDLIFNFNDFMNDKCKSDKTILKQALDSKQNEFTIKDLRVVVRNAKFGPVIEIFNKEEDKPKYIGIKPYMKSKGITDYLNIVEKDIKFLMKFPKRIEGEGYDILYASKGFYILNKETQKTKSVPDDNLVNLENSDYSFIPELFLKKEYIANKFTKKKKK